MSNGHFKYKEHNTLLKNSWDLNKLKYLDDKHAVKIKNISKILEKIEGTTTSSSHCSACGKPKSKYQKLRKCSGCHAVQYCNTECQKKHWKIGGHKKECKKLKQQQQQNTKLT